MDIYILLLVTALVVALNALGAWLGSILTRRRSGPNPDGLTKLKDAFYDGAKIRAWDEDMVLLDCGNCFMTYLRDQRMVGLIEQILLTEVYDRDRKNQVFFTYCNGDLIEFAVNRKPLSPDVPPPIYRTAHKLLELGQYVWRHHTLPT